MSDVVRYFICRQQSRGCYGAADALLAYNAERAEHAKEVEDIKFRCTWLHSDLEQQIADLKKRIAELTAQLEDEQLSKLTTIRTMADDCLRGRTGKSDVEILHEIVSLIDDEDEKPCP